MQGEREMAAQNRTLGKFDLVGIPSAPRGVPQIEVAFDIDANGIVHVSAKDMATGKEQKIRIESSSGLSEDEINNMVNEAEAHAEEDKKEKEKVEVTNEADAMIYSTEKSLKEYGDKVSEDDKSKIESALAELKTSVQGGDLEDIKAKVEALKQASYKLAEEMYKNASQSTEGAPGADPNAGAEAGPQGQDASPQNDDSTVEDADYEVVDDDKKIIQDWKFE